MSWSARAYLQGIFVCEESLHEILSKSMYILDNLLPTHMNDKPEWSGFTE